MTISYLLLLFITLYAHTSKSMLPNLDVFDEYFNDFSNYVQRLQNSRTQIEQALHNKTNLDAPLNTLSQMSALHEALDKPQLHDLVEPLLQAGANPNHKDGSAKWAPLHYVAKNKNTICYLRLLLKYNADVNTTNEKHETPLMFAVQQGNYEETQLLLNHSANPNIQDKWGNTALHRLCLHKADHNYSITLRQNMTQLLLYHGANPFIQNIASKTALDIARKNSLYTLVQLMENQNIRFARQLLITLKKAGVAADISIAQRIANFVYSSHA